MEKSAPLPRHSDEPSPLPPQAVVADRRSEAAQGPRPGESLDFDEVFRAHLSRVTRTLFSLGVPGSVRDDAVQDVFLVVHRRLREFEGRSRLSTWIYAITYRVAQNYRRKYPAGLQEELPTDHPSNALDPSEHLARQQALGFVQGFCNKLTDAKRGAFVLCVLEGRTAPQAAEILGVNVDTVYSRARTARTEFREALARLQKQEKTK